MQQSKCTLKRYIRSTPSYMYRNGPSIKTKFVGQNDVPFIEQVVRSHDEKTLMEGCKHTQQAIASASVAPPPPAFPCLPLLRNPPSSILKQFCRGWTSDWSARCERPRCKESHEQTTRTANTKKQTHNNTRNVPLYPAKPHATAHRVLRFFESDLPTEEPSNE